MTGAHTHTVLVVDDANGLVDIYERWLDDEFRVLTATDGQGAIATVDDTVDAVLMDRDLSKMSGSTVVEEIRERGHDPSVVLLSSVEPDLDVIGIEFEACLTKPVMRRDLVSEIERAAGEGSGDRPDSGSGSESGNATFGRETDDEDSWESIGEATTDETRTGTDASDSSGDDDAESDVTDRLQSLQADLEETADELSRRSGEDSGGDDETATGDREDADWTLGEPSRGDSAGDDRFDREEPGSDRDRPRDALPDEVEGPDESLQERVERLANKATDLAETPLEDDDDAEDDDAPKGEDADEPAAAEPEEVSNDATDG